MLHMNVGKINNFSSPAVIRFENTYFDFPISKWNGEAGWCLQG